MWLQNVHFTEAMLDLHFTVLLLWECREKLCELTESLICSEVIISERQLVLALMDTAQLSCLEHKALKSHTAHRRALTPLSSSSSSSSLRSSSSPSEQLWNSNSFVSDLWWQREMLSVCLALALCSFLHYREGGWGQWGQWRAVGLKF